MTDIVEQLRAEGAMTGYYHVPAIQRKAAAEIEWLREESERLRAEVVSLEATGAEAADEIERLRAEAKRLRRALQDIANATMSQFVRASDLADYQMEIARTALAEEVADD